MPGSVETPRHTSQAASEPEPLVSAANLLGNTPWPMTTRTSAKDRVMDFIFGATESAAVSEDVALQDYLAKLGAADQPVDQLLRDADESLARSRAVAEAGRQAATAYPPRRDDLIVLEQAIIDTRVCRHIYVSALKALKSSGHEVNDRDIRDLKHAFSGTIRDIGATADLLADRADDPDRAVRYAAPSAAHLD